MAISIRNGSVKMEQFAEIFSLCDVCVVLSYDFSVLVVVWLLVGVLVEVWLLSVAEVVVNVNILVGLRLFFVVNFEIRVDV